mgnify:CR=1 FL=1
MSKLTRSASTMAIATGLAMAPQAGPRDRQRPHIEPQMTLRPSAADASTYELMIYGDIGDSWWGESVTAQSVAQQLNDLPPTVATINVRINSYGGSVADGLAIYNALKRHKAAKTVTVDGVAMSSASLIAMAGDTVSMPPTSLLMIHAPWGGLYGNAKEMRQYADVLDTFSESMADAYVKKSGKSRDDVLALLTDGEDHYYTGDEAVAEGFADAIDTGDGDVGEPDENARAFAASLLERISARGAPARYAGMAVAAALRAAPKAKTTTQILTVTIDSSSVAEAIASAQAAAVAAAALNPPPTAGVQTPPADAGSTHSGETTMDPKAVLAADKQRRESIRNQFAPFVARTDLNVADLQTLQRECEDDTECTPEAAGQKLLAQLGKDTTPIAAAHRVEAGSRDETRTYREGGINAILHRANPSAHKLDDNSRQFAGFDLVDMARDSLERAGIRTRGMSKSDVAIKALHSTSDFPNILENVITKSLRAGYESSARTFTSWARQGSSLPDFKQVSRAQIAGAPSLKRVLEGAEYQEGTIGDGAEKYAVQKYGRIVHVSWETVINDDMDALTRIPQAFGASAADLESDLVYAILTGNPNMADGVALFHATHGNLGTATKLSEALNDAATLDPLAELREKMLLQKGLEGRYITVRPKFLIVPPKLEQTALRICSAAFVAAKGIDINVLGSMLTPVVEPRLHDSSDTAYYAAADASTVDTIEYAYLQGHEGVFTETQNGFEVDGLKVKCRHVFGAKAIDHRGLFKNVGA